MASTVLIDQGTALLRAARFDDDRLTSVIVKPNLPGMAQAVVGDRCRATLKRIDKVLGGVFLTLASGEPAFARLTEDWSGLSTGAAVQIHVETQARRDKNARVRLLGKGSRENRSEPVRENNQNTAFILAALELVSDDSDIVVASGQAKAALIKAAENANIGERVSQALVRPSVFLDNTFTDQLLEGLAPTVMLAGGGRLTIEETQALVAVDVDTHLAHHASRHALRLSVNRAALLELRRQCVLRRLGGQVVVDFLRVDKAKRPTFRGEVANAFADLPGFSRPHWTDGGLFICSLARTGPSVHEALTEEAPGIVAGRRLRHPVAAGLAMADLEDQLRRSAAGQFELSVPKAVFDFIIGQRPWLDQMTGLYTKRFTLTEAEGLEGSRHVCTQIR